MVDQAFAFLSRGPGSGIVALLEPEISGLTAIRHSEMGVDVAQEANPRHGVALVHLLADPTQTRPPFHQLGGGPQRIRSGAWVLETAGVGADSGEQTIRHRLGHLPTGPFAEIEN